MLTEKCPRCGSTNVRRSHRRESDPGPKSLPLFSRWFRCRECRSRFPAPDRLLILLSGLGILSVIVIAVTIAWSIRSEPTSPERSIVDQTPAAATDAPEADDANEQTIEDAEHRYRKAVELLRRSAQRGARSALPRAAEWLRQAAEEGHIRAQLMLGVLHEDGAGVIQDYEQALEWYRQAALQGDTVAMYRVGSMLRRGVGADRDLIEAYAWCNIAAARGHHEATIDRDQITHLLSSDEIKEAQQRSREFDEELPHVVATPFTLPAGL